MAYHPRSHSLDSEAIYDIPLYESEDHALVRLPVECKLFHLVSDHQIQLASGPLALLKPVPLRPSNTTAPELSSEVLLILQVGLATFPIHRHTPFGTTTACAFSYLFKPDLPGLPMTGYIKLTLPFRPIDAFPTILQPGQITPPRPSEPEAGEPPPPELVALRDSFEQVLVEQEILEGQSLLQAAAEELSKAFLHRSRSVVSRWAPQRIQKVKKDDPQLSASNPTGETRSTFLPGSLASTFDRWSMRFGKQLAQRLPPLSKSAVEQATDRVGQGPGSLSLNVVSEADLTVKDVAKLVIKSPSVGGDEMVVRDRGGGVNQDEGEVTEASFVVE
ncbi:hypothetical protein CROQUDRAFT_95470 [Cronartium quercuum f. sp. fusiforme G11]|uniref:Uncharacterized protein n=1 Tax=Cronartium quercuum f. sp. fusiforme G11 TaxID=708437 RepID=A0A9P6NH74_9BASI|nr:hypothetical protein CROQUDRAFT_95470 [Cronartium quercuum f. sp. fusiforme G11]